MYSCIDILSFLNDYDRFSAFYVQVITFIDLAGHERYLKTTVFGMTGHAPDFAMLMVSHFLFLFNCIFVNRRSF